MKERGKPYIVLETATHRVSRIDNENKNKVGKVVIETKENDLYGNPHWSVAWSTDTRVGDDFHNMIFELFDSLPPPLIIIPDERQMFIREATRARDSSHLPERRMWERILEQMEAMS